MGLQLTVLAPGYSGIEENEDGRKSVQTSFTGPEPERDHRKVKTLAESPREGLPKASAEL